LRLGGARESEREKERERARARARAGARVRARKRDRGLASRSCQRESERASERERESVRKNKKIRTLPTETKVESGTSQSKSGTSVNLSNSGDLAPRRSHTLTSRLMVFDLSRGGLVFKSHRLLYHSTLGLRVVKKKKKSDLSAGIRFNLNRTDLIHSLSAETLELLAFFARKLPKDSKFVGFPGLKNQEFLGLFSTYYSICSD